VISCRSPRCPCHDRGPDFCLPCMCSVQASIPAKTYVISGAAETKRECLEPDVLYPLTCVQLVGASTAANDELIPWGRHSATRVYGNCQGPSGPRGCDLFSRCRLVAGVVPSCRASGPPPADHPAAGHRQPGQPQAPGRVLRCVCQTKPCGILSVGAPGQCGTPGSRQNQARVWLVCTRS
jgi:hypothetical protein